MWALEWVGFAQKVLSLPRGLDTPLGRLSEQDADLSGGEWQRLSIARALLRPYGMLLLDEPSSALDPVAERNFLDEIASLRPAAPTICSCWTAAASPSREPSTS